MRDGLVAAFLTDGFAATFLTFFFLAAAFLAAFFVMMTDRFRDPMAAGTNASMFAASVSRNQIKRSLRIRMFTACNGYVLECWELSRTWSDRMHHRIILGFNAPVEPDEGVQLAVGWFSIW